MTEKTQLVKKDCEQKAVSIVTCISIKLANVLEYTFKNIPC